MYTLSRSIPLRQMVTEQLPMLFGSVLIAELFYKFHSFTLEAIAFLFTWYFLDAFTEWLGITSGSRGTKRNSRE